MRIIILAESRIFQLHSQALYVVVITSEFSHLTRTMEPRRYFKKKFIPYTGKFSKNHG